MSECYPVQNGKMNWFTKIVFSIMLIVLAVFPFGMAVVNMVSGYVGYWDKMTISVMGLVVVGLIVVFCVAMMKSTSSKLSRAQVTAVSIGLFGLSVVIRVLCSYLLQTQPTSDFKTCFDYAVSSLSNRFKNTDGYLKTYPYLGAYALTLRLLFSIFPPEVLTAQVFNAVVQSLIPCFLFLSIRKLTGDNRPAVVGALLYALNPSMIVYSSILSCEHVAQLFCALVLMVHAYWVDAKSEKKKCILSIVLGWSLGCLELYKPIMFIFAAAIAMAYFCFQIIPCVHALLKKDKKAGKKLLTAVEHIAIVLLVAMVVSDIGIYGVCAEIVGPLEDVELNIGATLYFGLNPKTAGLWDAEVVQTIKDVRSLYPDEGEAALVLLQKLWDLYQGDLALLGSVQMEKLSINWCQEAVYYWWTVADDPVVQGTAVGETLFGLVPNLYAILLYSLCSIGLIVEMIRMLFSKQLNFGRSHSMFVCVGCVFLFSLMLTLMESQGRYKSNIMPYICSLGGIGMWLIADNTMKGYVKATNCIKTWCRNLKHP